MQRNFGAMQKQVEAWRETELSNVAAKMIVYEVSIKDGDSLQNNPGEGMPEKLERRADLQGSPDRAYNCREPQRHRRSLELDRWR